MTGEDYLQRLLADYPNLDENRIRSATFLHHTTPELFDWRWFIEEVMTTVFEAASAKRRNPNG